MDGPTRPARRLDRSSLLVATGALALALALYFQFLPVHRALWWSAIHDRNAHTLNGLNFARDVRHGDLRHLAGELEDARFWGPLNNVLVGLALLGGDPDHRRAVLPSLMAWWGTVLLCFLVARRLAPAHGNLAGLAAALFAASSPAHRAFATDVMFESPGAFLTLLVLYLHLAARSRASAWSYRGLGLALTVLFFYKYNYWLLVGVALGLSAAWEEHRSPERRVPLRPLASVLLLSAAAWAAITLLVPLETLQSLLRRGSLHGRRDYLCLLYWVLLATAGWAWWARGPRVALPPPLRTLARWHALPVALSFLFPRRLGCFLAYIHTGTNSGERPEHGVLGGLLFHGRALADEYHAHLAAALCALALLGIALARFRRLRPGAGAVWLLLGLGFVLTIPHPNRKARFLHSWVPAAWVLAGAGLAAASRFPWTARLAAGALAVFVLPALARPGRATEGGPRPAATSNLELTDRYLPDLAGSRQAALVANVPIKFLLAWTYQERYPASPRPEVADFCFWTADEIQAFREWLARSRADRLVAIDVLPGTGLAESPNPAPPGSVVRLLERQRVFRLVHRRPLPALGCEVSLWRRPGARDR